MGGRPPWTQLSTLPAGGRRHESRSKRTRGWAGWPTPSSPADVPRALLRVHQPDSLHPPRLGPGIEDPQGHDAAGLLARQRLAQVALGADRLAFYRENDVRAAPLRVVEQDLPGRASGSDVGDDQAPGIGRDVELLGGVGRDRLD